MKPLGRKNYGSIAHLPNSRMGPADHKITDGQAKIATEKVRDKHDHIVVQEKLDGSNVGVCLINGRIIALGRAGYEASTSRFKMHQEFDNWVHRDESRFREILQEGHRICGEWLIQAHGTIYDLPHEPFVAFDMIDDKNKRMIYEEFVDKLGNRFVLPEIVSVGNPISVKSVMQYLGEFGFHGAKERIEGAVWRVERKGAVDYLCKYVRPDKIDGKYLDCDEPVMNTWSGK